MNILFVNYGDFTTNSLNHIAGFANGLSSAGHTCVVAVSHAKETLRHIREPLFIPATYEELLSRPTFFPNNKPADIIHAWTPREGVRKFVLSYQRLARTPARLVIHLEDNERFLTEAFTGKSFEELLSSSAGDVNGWLVDGLSHPARHEAFLRIADGVTIIVDRLRELVPAGIPVQLLPPGVDFTLYHPQAPDRDFRKDLGIADDERVLAFTGSTTFANELEVRDLYLAVALLNQRGIATRLVRSGFSSPQFVEKLPEDVRRHVLDLGFIDKGRLPKLLALADVLVQPGRVGAFNDYRLPSKLPEFLAMGKPVALPPSNIALLLRDGEDAVFLPGGSPEEIASTCAHLFAAPALCSHLGKNAVAFARRHFDSRANTEALAAFYARTREESPRVDWNFAHSPGSSEASLLLDRLHRTAENPTPNTVELAAGIGLLRSLVRHVEENAEAKIAAQAADLEARRATTALAEQLTQQHIRNIETLLASARQESASRAEALRSREDALAHAHQELGRAHQDVIRSQQDLARFHDELAVTRAAHAEELAREAVRRNQLREHAETLLERNRARLSQIEASLAGKVQYAGELERRVTDLELQVARLERKMREQQSVTQQREDKIRRMQSSASWRLTAPLRAARRMIFDVRSPVAQNNAPPARLRFHFDQPSHWDAAPPNGSIAGWCVTSEGAPVLDVRVRINGEEISGVYGLSRHDVVRAEGFPPSSARCGFQIGYRLPVDSDQPVTIEAQISDGTWHAFSEQRLRTSQSPRAVRDYAAWVAEFDTFDAEKIHALRTRLAELRPEQRPLISVLMPVYNPPERWLPRAIESVCEQVYENWELCIADDASTAPHVRPLLESFAARDPRIRVTFRPQNGHISAASNSALELVRGPYVALLDHDDELSADALAEVALRLARDPDVDVIFSDEDKIDETGRRYDPYFKPDYLPDLLLGQNCLSHLSVYRTELMRAVGGFRVGYEGSQDWDLALRMVENTAPERVVHIPKVLYHWRAIEGSTALAVSEKNYASEAARRALSDHFARRGIKIELRSVPGNHWQIVYPLPEKLPLVSIIIPTRNGVDLLRTCIASIVTHTEYARFEILIVNNQSDDPATLTYFLALAREENIRVVNYDAPFNYSAINNFAAREARGEMLCFLNNDIEVITGCWLDEMVSHAARPEIGAVGAMLYYPNGTIQHAGVVLGLGGVANHAFLHHPCGTHGYMNRARLTQNYSAVTAACLLVRRTVFEEVAGFNAEDLAVAFNDIDLCLRIRAAGYRNLWTPFAEFYHHESATRGSDNTPEKQARFVREIEYMRKTWGPLLDRDPAYNPNLSLDLLGWTLAWPPRTNSPAVKERPAESVAV